MTSTIATVNDIAAPTDASLAEFIRRWQSSGAAERANYVLFLTQLCDVLAVSEPNPTTDDPEKNSYVFERDVTFDQGDGTTTTGRIDLYKRGCFVLEAKQGRDAQREEEEAAQSLADPATKKARKKGTAVRGTKAWDDAMIRARGQANRYAQALPTGEGWPPFLIVVDVGHVIELYSEFTRQGRTYIPFPDPQSFRIKLTDLADEKIRERLLLVWTDPLALDPSKKSAKVTRELALRLAELAKLLERDNHEPARVARFLMRCLFTMFAEDVELIPKDSFKTLLHELEDAPENFRPMVEALWQTMDTGGFSTILRKHVARFNGGLFAEHDALNLSRPMLKLLRQAAEAFWGDVEPAIFGTLLERALDPIERHKLGAHYTPRAYVERLVMPTIIEPLRDEWNTIYATALTHAREGDLKEAQRLVRKFHDQLCEIHVLDPACGSGNFLYVALEHMKRLEGEVLVALGEFGDKHPLLALAREVDPNQFLGIEINPRAAAIADLVLWIGYLQWHRRTRGKASPAEPIIKNYKNIECRDAVLAWDHTEPLLDDAGQPVTRWDGRTTKTHPVTGEQVPDETAQVPVLKYINPQKAEWPPADYVVGNPPFVGNFKMRSSFGDGYVDAVRETWDEVSETCDYVMFWWNMAANLVSHGQLRQFGLIATNSLRQKFNRQTVQRYLDAGQLSVAFAIPDHPWIDAADGAAVRISMTVGSPPMVTGRLFRVVDENDGPDGTAIVALCETKGRINADLTIGADLSKTRELRANSELSCPGVKLHGAGFIVTPEEAKSLGLGKVVGLERHIRHYRNGRDVTGTSRQVMVIDLLGLTDGEVRARFPAVYQWVVERVKPERDQNKRESRKRYWWLFGEPISTFRPALESVKRFITTVETAKHRVFTFLDGSVLPDNMLINFALDDAYFLGIVSSRVHTMFALASGGTLEDRPRYNKTRCFEPFPFPVCEDDQRARIRDFGEQLEAHRKRQQEQHPWLTLTDMYNVLEKLRSGEALTDKDQKIHHAGLVSVLQQIHDDLDAAVSAAYGWPATLSDEEILERLVALNAERAAEEARGLIRYLRPEFQCRTKLARSASEGSTQKPLQLPDDTASETAPPKKGRKPAAPTTPKPAKSSKLPWPKDAADRTKAIRDALSAAGAPVSLSDLSARFLRARRSQVEEILAALVTLGHAHRQRGGNYTE